MQLSTTLVTGSLLAFLACPACAGDPNNPSPKTLATGQEPVAKQAEVTLTLTADPAEPGSRMYNFRAQIIGGADNDERLYCAATTWAFGDGPAMTSTPSCAPWALDVKIQRVFMTSHLYKEPGGYVASFTYGPLSVQRTIDVK